MNEYILSGLIIITSTLVCVGILIITSLSDKKTIPLIELKDVCVEQNMSKTNLAHYGRNSTICVRNVSSNGTSNPNINLLV